MTSQVMQSVVSSMNGSMYAVAGSGISSMSDAWMPFQPGDRRAVERMTRLELVGVERLGGHGDVLLLAARVGEAEVDELDFLVLDQLQHVGCGGHLQKSPRIVADAASMRRRGC